MPLISFSNVWIWSSRLIISTNTRERFLLCMPRFHLPLLANSNFDWRLTNCSRASLATWANFFFPLSKRENKRKTHLQIYFACCFDPAFSIKYWMISSFNSFNRVPNVFTWMKQSFTSNDRKVKSTSSSISLLVSEVWNSLALKLCFCSLKNYAHRKILKIWSDMVDILVQFAGEVSLFHRLVPFVQQWKPSNAVYTTHKNPRVIPIRCFLSFPTRCLAILSFNRSSNSLISATCSTLAMSFALIPCWINDDWTECS